LMGVVSLIVCANIVVSLINLTGLGVKLTSAILALAGTNVILALIFAAIVVTILGMGLPPVAAYVLAAAVAGPALSNLGIAPLSANMFIFYFSCLGAITPPVCIAAMTAAALAQADWFKTAIISCRLAAVAFFLPFVFVFQPALLFEGPIVVILLSAVSVLAGTVLIGFVFWGSARMKLKLISRFVLFPAGVLLLTAQWQLVLIGIGVAALGFLSNYLLNMLTKKRLSPSG
jgi:TRAP-type uncharacterized transport system fused permease subunit